MITQNGTPKRGRGRPRKSIEAAPARAKRQYIRKAKKPTDIEQAPVELPVEKQTTSLFGEDVELQRQIAQLTNQRDQLRDELYSLQSEKEKITVEVRTNLESMNRLKLEVAQLTEQQNQLRHKEPAVILSDEVIAFLSVLAASANQSKSEIANKLIQNGYAMHALKDIFSVRVKV